MPLMIKNKLEGRTEQDHRILEKELELDDFGNKLINCNKPLSREEESHFIRPGIWLALWMGVVWVREMNEDNLGTFLHRAFALQVWDNQMTDESTKRSPFGLGSTQEEMQARVGGLHKRLSGWIDKDWTMETNHSSGDDVVATLEQMLDSTVAEEEEAGEALMNEQEKVIHKAIKEIREQAEARDQLTKQDEDKIFAVKHGHTYKEFRKIRADLATLLASYYEEEKKNAND
jgi:hypothetical protein